MALADLNQDSRPDIVVGNDFDELDGYWLSAGPPSQPEWQAAMPFDTISHSTMSFDWGDMDNDGPPGALRHGHEAVRQDIATLAEWLPMMPGILHRAPAPDPQIMENVSAGAGGAVDSKIWPDRGVDATGWSWSAKFGDLDQDGCLDLYVVNGMIEAIFRMSPPTNWSRRIRSAQHRRRLLRPGRMGDGLTAAGGA